MNQEVLRAVPEVVGKLRDEIRKTKLKLSLTEDGKEGKSKIIASNNNLELKPLELCNDEGIGMSDSVDNDNDNDNDTLKKVPHPSNEGLALQARVKGS